MFFQRSAAQQPVGFLLWRPAVCCSRWSLSEGLRSVMKMVCGTLSEKPDYFDPLTYFGLNEMWATENWKKKKGQFSTELKFNVRELLVDWSLNRVLLLSVTAIMPFVLLFPDKLGVNLRGLCLDQCLLNPWNYSMARWSSWNLRKQMHIHRMTLHLLQFYRFKVKWVGRVEGPGDPLSSKLRWLCDAARMTMCPRTKTGGQDVQSMRSRFTWMCCYLFLV